MALPTVKQIALIGCGAAGRLIHVPAIKRLQEEGLVKFAYAVDPVESNLKLLKTDFPDLEVCETTQILEDKDLDIVIIASPPRYHAEQVIKLSKFTKAILCEKPMALSPEQARMMIASCKGKGVKLAIGFFRRFLPSARLIQTIVKKNLLGKIKGFNFVEGVEFAWPASANFFVRKEAGGGVLLDLGSHGLDLIYDWFGEPQSVAYEDDAMGGLENNCIAHFEYKNGVSGKFRLSRDFNLQSSYKIFFEKGYIDWRIDDFLEMSIGFAGTPISVSGFVSINNAFGLSPPRRDENYGLLYTGKFSDKIANPSGQAYLAQLENLVCALDEMEDIVVGGEEGLGALRLVEYCYKSRGLIDMGWLSEQERAIALRLQAGQVGAQKL